MSSRARDKYEQLIDQAVEDVQENIEYVCVVQYDDEVIARVTAKSPESLQEQLSKLERAELAFTEQRASEHIDEGYYDGE